MSRSKASNAVVSAVQQACALYRVPCWRTQSRVFNVADARDARGFRPVASGEWIDELGEKHTSGMADLLAQPRVFAYCDVCEGDVYATVPLWIECKSGSGRLSAEQKLFRDYVVKIGAYYIEARDCADEVLAWLKKMKAIR